MARSGYYQALARAATPGPRRQRDAQLSALIAEEHAHSRGTYGAPRIHHGLHQRGERLGRKRVARLMRASGLRGCAPARRRVLTTDSRHDEPVAPHRLAGRPAPTRVGEVWLADITYIRTGEGWLYFAGVKDACSRRLVGGAISATIDTDLVLAAWRQACLERAPRPGLIFSLRSRRAIRQHCFPRRARRGRRRAQPEPPRQLLRQRHDGVGLGHAQNECVYRHHFSTHAQARAALFDYVQFYNRRRHHSALGYLCPVDFENQIH